MAATLTLSILEIVLLLFGAIILGITIHFFIASRRNLKAATEEMERTSFARDEWKLRYFNDMEARDKEMTDLKLQVQEAEENSRIYSMEMEDMRRNNKLLKTEIDNARQSGPQQEESDKVIQELEAQVSRLQHDLNNARAVEAQHQHQLRTIDNLQQQMATLRKELEDARAIQLTAEAEKPRTDDSYLEQLRQAQKSLAEHNQKINDLLGNIDIIKEKEEKQREILRNNEELYTQLTDMRNMLSEKEKEIHSIRQQQQLTSEMSSMLDNAYSEFNVLQGKIQKLETQLTASKMMNLEMEDLREEHTRIVRELDEQKTKASRLSLENQQLQSLLGETEDKLREVNVQRQQLQKRVAYLEELNNDLQVVSEANKKLESQLRRVSELESMLHVVSEERDQLMRRQPGNKSA